jgi:adhesin transport system outer membrane protein
MKKLSLVTALLLPALVSAMSITEAVQETIKTHPQMEIKKEELLTQKELLTSTRAGYLPSINLSYSVGTETTKTIANAREKVRLAVHESSASLSQNVFSGFDTIFGVQQQKALILSASNSVEEGANDLALETATYYLNVLKNYELLKIAQENVAVHKKYLSQIKQKVDAGVGRSSDYKQTLSRYEGALSNQYLTQQNYDNSVTSFKRVLPGDISAKDLQKPTIGSMPAENLEALIQMAIENNPTIDVSNNNITAADAQAKRSNAPFYPKANIEMESYWNENLNGITTDAGKVSTPDNYEKNSGHSTMLVLSYNIFNGFADKANREAYKHNLLKKKSDLSDAKRYVKAKTQIAWQTFNLTKQQLVHINNNMESTSQTVSDYLKENELGRRSILDLLNVELEYNSVKNTKVTAEYDNLTAYYEILSHTGKILQEMNVLVK